MQDSHFASKAIDVAVNELIAVASPGAGMTLFLYLCKFLFLLYKSSI